MTATTIEVTCPTCRTLLALPSFGHFSCPKCGQKIEVGKAEPLEYPQLLTAKQRTKKLEVNNGFGWWTFVAVLGWLAILSACGFFLFAAAGIFTTMNTANSDVQVGGVAIALTFGIPGAIIALVGIGFLCWASSAKRTLICGQCRNPTTTHAKLCASCKAEF